MERNINIQTVQEIEIDNSSTPVAVYYLYIDSRRAAKFLDNNSALAFSEIIRDLSVMTNQNMTCSIGVNSDISAEELLDNSCEIEIDNLDS
jgi:hypothetical protein